MQSRLRRAPAHHSAYAGAMCFALLLLAACSDKDQQRTPPAPIPVRVATATAQDFPIQLKSLGTVTPLNSVVVRSRIDGELVEVLFTEGQTVRQGQLLAQIDPRPREADLAEAVGRQQEAKVQLQNADEELARLNDLMTKNYVSKQAVTNQEALVRQFRARLESADAAVSSAKLQLDFTRIVAPISGRLGLRRVDRGNLIRSGDADGLVSITQVQPISVVFTIPETEVTAVLDAYRANKNLTVEAWDRDGQQRLALGAMAGVDNQIDTATGTLRLKASFANEDGRLFPNQFVNVRLHVRIIENAIVIPGAAVQYGAQSTYVFAIEDNKARMREVSLGRADDDKVVVTKGLNGGELIVLEGLERLRDGRAVQIIDPNAPMEPKQAKPERRPGSTGAPPSGQRRTN
jgi:multidrug efflux system membrane fusion protein